MTSKIIDDKDDPWKIFICGVAAGVVLISIVGFIFPCNEKRKSVAEIAKPPSGIQRYYLDGHLYYSFKHRFPSLTHAAGCTNHAPCAQTVLQLEK